MSDSNAIGEQGSGVIPLSYKDVDQLHSAFMPFLKNGGLFIPTNIVYSMGQAVWMVVQLPEVDEKFQVKGVVSWLTPENSTYRSHQGVGVEFADGNGVVLRHRIKTLLADIEDNKAETFTL